MQPVSWPCINHAQSVYLGSPCPIVFNKFHSKVAALTINLNTWISLFLPRNAMQRSQHGWWLRFLVVRFHQANNHCRRSNPIFFKTLNSMLIFFNLLFLAFTIARIIRSGFLICKLGTTVFFFFKLRTVHKKYVPLLDFHLPICVILVYCC